MTIPIQRVSSNEDTILPIRDEAEMEKRADTADISVLFFSDCANFLAVYAQTN